MLIEHNEEVVNSINNSSEKATNKLSEPMNVDMVEGKCVRHHTKNFKGK